MSAQSFLWWLKTFGGVVVAGETMRHTLFLKNNAEWWFRLLLFFFLFCPYLNEIQHLSETSSFSKGTSFPCRCLLNFCRQTKVDVLFGTVVIPYKMFLPLLQRNKVLFTSSWYYHTKPKNKLQSHIYNSLYLQESDHTQSIGLNEEWLNSVAMLFSTHQFIL